MYEIFNQVDGNYILPNGASKTSADLKKDPQYRLMFNKDCVVNIVDGVLMSFKMLAQLADQYGISYSSDSSDDPAEILSKINAIKSEQDAQNAKVSKVMPAVVTAAMFSAASFTDEQALEVKDLYPDFEVGRDYKKDERFIYNGHLFKVNQDHTSQKQWVPGETGTESLYTNLELNEGGYLVWQQPTGAHDAYNKGDIVDYNGQLYKSLIDGNVYSPDAYPAGWEKYTEE